MWKLDLWNFILLTKHLIHHLKITNLYHKPLPFINSSFTLQKLFAISIFYIEQVCGENIFFKSDNWSGVCFHLQAFFGKGFLGISSCYGVACLKPTFLNHSKTHKHMFWHTHSKTDSFIS